MSTYLSLMDEYQLSHKITIVSPLTGEVTNNVLCDDTTVLNHFTNVFGTKTIDTNILQFKSTFAPNDVNVNPANPMNSVTNSDSVSGYSEIAERTITTELEAAQLQKRLDNPKGEQLGYASRYLLQDNSPSQSFPFWNTIDKPDLPELSDLFRRIVLIYADAYHTKGCLISVNDLTAITTIDFNHIFKVLHGLRKKSAIAELAIMILLANAVMDQRWLKRMEFKSESGFFKAYAEEMRISASKARDYVLRGRIFLEYRDDILNGIENITGMKLEDFASSCMAKLTLYAQAALKLGRKQALINLKELKFRDFKKAIINGGLNDEKTKPKKPPTADDNHADDLIALYACNKSYIEELNLLPNERRLLRIIVKGGIFVYVERPLTDKEVELIESRLRESRIKTLENNYKTYLPDTRKPFDPAEPFLHPGGLFEVNDFREIVLRIRSAIAMIQPVRRLIAILLYRLYYEKHFSHKWKNPRDGVKYSSFRDFAIEEIGMSEDYRDYLAVGKVIKNYYYFLEYLTDMDTEETFLKLRYLPDALKTHQKNEPLILARLRSLSVREFKIFSLYPDFETTFTKRLTNKHIEEFERILRASRYPIGGPTVHDFIEAYSEYEKRFVWKTVRDFIDEASESSLTSTGTYNEPNNSDMGNEINNEGFHDISNSSDQQEVHTVA